MRPTPRHAARSREAHPLPAGVAPGQFAGAGRLISVVRRRKQDPWRSLALLALSLSCWACSGSQKMQEPERPPDVPILVQSKGAEDLLFESFRPAIERARSTLPSATARYLAGLEDGEAFYVTTRLHDAGRVEQVFIKVERIAEDKYFGTLASDVQLITNYSAGDPLVVDSADVIDWTLAKADGSEDGNFVGKFIDQLQQGQH